MPPRTFSIGTLARDTGVNIETIRYYERIGLLPAPPRTKGNYRSYGLAHRQKLAFIRRARDLGFTMEQVRTLLVLSDHNANPCAEVDSLARQRLADVEQKILGLRKLRSELRDMIGRCERSTVSDCRVIRTLRNF